MEKDRRLDILRKDEMDPTLYFKFRILSCIKTLDHILKVHTNALWK